MTKETLPSIEEIQEVIVAEFRPLQNDREATLTYIMEIGERLKPMADHCKTEHNAIRGCISKVWLTYRREGERLFFEADSNTAITKGLISLLLRVLSGQTLENIINANLYFVKGIGIVGMIGPQRSGGFANMLRAIKLIAVNQQLLLNAATPHHG